MPKWVKWFLSLFGWGSIKSRDGGVDIHQPWFYKVVNFAKSYWGVLLALFILWMIGQSDLSVRGGESTSKPVLQAPVSITVVDECQLVDPDTGRTFVALDCMKQSNLSAVCAPSITKYSLISLLLGSALTLLGHYIYLRRTRAAEEGDDK